MADRNVRAAAIAAGILIVAVAAFQLALVFGAPLGDATFGGRAATRDGVLSTGFRVIAALNVLILFLFAWIILLRAGVLKSSALGNRFVYWAAWAIVGYLAINTLGNLAASHPLERWGAGSITLVLVILCGIVALRSPDNRR